MALALCLFACATQLTPTNYYVLGLPVAAPPPGEPVFPVSLAVASFEADSPLLRRNIVWRENNTIGFYTNERWAELPGRLFAHRLYRRAAGSGLFERVKLGAISNNADFSIRGKILTFEETTTAEGKFGKVAADVELLDQSGAVRWSGTLEKTEPVQGEGAQATVQAISRAAEATITSILSSVAQTLRQTEPGLTE